MAAVAVMLGNGPAMVTAVIAVMTMACECVACAWFMVLQQRQAWLAQANSIGFFMRAVLDKRASEHVYDSSLSLVIA